MYGALGIEKTLCKYVCISSSAYLNYYISDHAINTWNTNTSEMIHSLIMYVLQYALKCIAWIMTM